jgi:hypothetical protein
MERDAWITAAWMVQRHGAGAFKAVESKMEKIRRDGVDEDHLRSLRSSDSPRTLKLCTELGARPPRAAPW